MKEVAAAAVSAAVTAAAAAKVRMTDTSAYTLAATWLQNIEDMKMTL
jgi:hypothetical protein